MAMRVDMPAVAVTVMWRVALRRAESIMTPGGASWLSGAVASRMEAAVSGSLYGRVISTRVSGFELFSDKCVHHLEEFFLVRLGEECPGSDVVASASSFVGFGGFHHDVSEV